jgi:glyoxylate reductase
VPRRARPERVRSGAVSGRPRIFVTQPVAASAARRLEALGDVTWRGSAPSGITRAELLAGVREAAVLVCLINDVVDAEVLAAGPGLRLIASMAIIPASIDVAEATRRRVAVTVIPQIVTEATADLTFGLILAVSRRLVEADRRVRAGEFPAPQSPALEGRYVHGKTLGLVGAGRIGRAVARRARGFDMRLLYADPRPLPPAEEAALGLTRQPLDRLLAGADVVSVHAASTPETFHLIGAAELARMKPTAYLVNTSRGPVVDERALAQALREGRIAGAALDVYEREPQVEPTLLRLPNVVLVPHIGSAVDELREAMANIVVDNVEAFLAGRRPPNCVNPEVLPGS